MQQPVRFFDNQSIIDQFGTVSQCTSVSAKTAEDSYVGSDKKEWPARAWTAIGNLSGILFGAVGFWRDRRRDVAAMEVIAHQAEALRPRAELLVRDIDATPAAWRALGEAAAALEEPWQAALEQCLSPAPATGHFNHRNNALSGGKEG